ncbi:hypothetical protein D918_09705 [Trichuris suis]|uniref:Uncharacterized protein n=1 Tax=Trichuris suis TaxID=68888 RepID=A0A085LQ15_9BILA|nr:hypothetical protein M513_12049 [Trichuris suis]KHJ40262.1 hypothetical protein D918_09705 [Trichuris suis]
MDYPAAHAVFESKSDRQGRSGPRAIVTPFGWSIIGPLPCKLKRSQQRHCYRLAAYDSSGSTVAERLLDKFFNCELTCAPLSDEKRVSPEEKRAWRILKETTQFNGERYQVGLLWKYDQPGLPVNRVTALRRFAFLEHRLNADPEMREVYRCSAGIH